MAMNEENHVYLISIFVIICHRVPLAKQEKVLSFHNYRLLKINFPKWRSSDI